MAVHTNSVTYTNTIDGTPLNWLLANVGDEITIIYDISIKEFAINSTENSWVNNNRDGYLGQYWVTGGDFSKFEVGDTITIYNYVSNLLNGTTTIVEKLSQSEIRLSSNPAGWGDNQPGFQDVFSKVKPVTSLVYKWNLIENGDPTNFYSKIDGTEQVASVNGLVATGSATKPMIMLGPEPYKTGSITVRENGLTTVPVYASNFVVTHRTRITPTMLAAQWDDILGSVAPDYFFNQNCLKPVYYFEARYNLTDPNNIQTILVDDQLGNTGWFNENWNTGATKYSISSLAYTDTLGPLSVPKVQLKTGNATKFSFQIRNPTTHPFVTTGHRIELAFAKAPNFESEYQGNTRDLRHNFVWETVTLGVAVAPAGVNGDNYGDASIRSLANCKATYNSPDTITITGSIDFLTAALNVFNESDEPRYMFWVSVANPATPGANSDRVTLLIDAAPFYFKTDFPNLVQFTTKLIPHDVPNYTDAFILRDVFTEDELVGYSDFIFQEDENNHTTSKVITRLTGKVIAINTVSNAQFTLETNTINVSTAPFIGGNQYFNVVQAKPIHVPVNEIRKNIIARFDTALNKYNFAYPYLNRWEYWVALQGVASNFFNTSQPNNGTNHDWRHYNTGNWQLAYVTEIGMKVNGVPAIYTSKVNYIDRDRNLAGEDTICVIDTLDPDTLTPLVNGLGKKFILGYKPTLVRAVFLNGINGFTPSDMTVVIGIEVYEEGGVNGKRRMSSKYPSDSDTWFTPLPGETKTKLTFTGADTICTAETYIDFNAINLSKQRYKLTARIYNYNDGGSSGGTLNYTNNYLGDQSVYLIKDDPLPQTPVITPNVVTDCDSDFIWRVLADANTTDPLRNDKNSFLWWFDKDAVETAVLYLILPTGIDVNLTGNTALGTPYNYGFYSNGQNEKLVGYLINWKAVMATYGACIYQIKVVTTTAFGGGGTLYSEKYCLKQYTDARAENTVRVEYTFNGILGLNSNDYKVKDLGTLNWYNQHRFDGVFHYLDSPYTTDEVQYPNGARLTVEDAQEPEYILKLKSIPAFKHNVLRTDILMSDEVLITDYNSKNIEVYYKKSVRKNSEYAPKWNVIKTKLAPVEVKFKQAINNLRKFIS